MSDLRRAITLSLSGIIIMALAGLVESSLAFWTGLTMCGIALVWLARLTLKESN